MPSSRWELPIQRAQIPRFHRSHDEKKQEKDETQSLVNTEAGKVRDIQPLQGHSAEPTRGRKELKKLRAIHSRESEELLGTLWFGRSKDDEEDASKL